MNNLILSAINPFALYSEEMKRAVWAKTTPPGLLFNPAEYGFDANSKLIRFADFGDTNSPYGWQFDHFPISKANQGPDALWNLRPLNCHDNAANRHHTLIDLLLAK
jgi:hypothetical protein